MPISDTQYRDFLHALTHMGDGAMEDVTSLIGDFMDVEHDLSGVMLNDVFSANKGVTGLFGHLLKDILGPDQTSHTPEQILSPFDQSDHNQGDHAIDQFGKPNGLETETTTTLVTPSLYLYFGSHQGASQNHGQLRL